MGMTGFTFVDNANESSTGTVMLSLGMPMSAIRENNPAIQ